MGEGLGVRSAQVVRPRAVQTQSRQPEIYAAQTLTFIVSSRHILCVRQAWWIPSMQSVVTGLAAISVVEENLDWDVGSLMVGGVVASAMLTAMFVTIFTAYRSRGQVSDE